MLTFVYTYTNFSLSWGQPDRDNASPGCLIKHTKTTINPSKRSTLNTIDSLLPSGIILSTLSSATLAWNVCPFWFLSWQSDKGRFQGVNVSVSLEGFYTKTQTKELGGFLIGLNLTLVRDDSLSRLSLESEIGTIPRMHFKWELNFPGAFI